MHRRDVRALLVVICTRAVLSDTQVSCWGDGGLQVSNPFGVEATLFLPGAIAIEGCVQWTGLAH